MNFFLSVSSFVFPLITFPYVSRVLTAEGVGAVSFALSFVSYFTLVASLGIPTYGIRACAEVKKDKNKLNNTVQELLIINTVTTILTVGVYLALVQVVPKLAEDKILFYICGLNIALNTLGANWFFQALEQFDYITIRSIVFKVISLALLVVLVHEISDYVIYAAITVFAAAGSCVLNFIKMVRMGVFNSKGNYSFRKHIKPILILFAQSATVSIYTNLDNVMLGLMRSDAEVGYYYVAIQIKQLMLMVITSLANVLLPRMTIYAREKNKDLFLKTMALGLNFSLFLSLPVALFSIIAAPDLILVLAGQGYQSSIFPTQILMFALVGIGLSQVIGIQVLTPLKREKQVFYSVLIGAIINVCFNLILIPSEGVIGVAISTFVAEFIVLFIQLWVARTLIKEVAREIFVLRYTLGSIMSFCISAFVYQFFADWFFLRVIIAGFIFGITYLTFLIIKKDFIMQSMFSKVKIRVKK